jgi:hypothetical protein
MLQKHVDKFCGTSPDKLFEKEQNTGISIARFSNVPGEGVTTYVTIGLSAHSLKQDSNTDLRQELIMTVDAGFADALRFENVMMFVALRILESHSAVALGEVIGPYGPLFPEQPQMNVTALACSGPACFDEGFTMFEAKGEPTIMVELIPLTTPETKMIEHEGWDDFYDRMLSGEIDYFDYSR